MTKQHEDLIIALQREVVIIRELLDNLEEEHQASLLNKPVMLMKEQRNILAQTLFNARNSRLKQTENLAQSQGLKPEDIDLGNKESFCKLLDFTSPEGCELLTLREQIITLLQKIKHYNPHCVSPLKKQVQKKRQYTKTLI